MEDRPRANVVTTDRRRPHRACAVLPPRWRCRASPRRRDIRCEIRLFQHLGFGPEDRGNRIGRIGMGGEGAPDHLRIEFRRIADDPPRRAAPCPAERSDTSSFHGAPASFASCFGDLCPNSPGCGTISRPHAAASLASCIHSPLRITQVDTMNVRSIQPINVSTIHFGHRPRTCSQAFGTDAAAREPSSICSPCREPQT